MLLEAIGPRPDIEARSNQAGAARSGWVKYDADGWIVDEGRIGRT